MERVTSVKLPEYFYTLNHPKRWEDPYANWDQETKFLTQKERMEKKERDLWYDTWLGMFDLKGKQKVWQAVRILAYKHSESNHNDWWENYQDAVFRVFVQPETIYCENTGLHKQWYVLSPEDCRLVNAHKISQHGASHMLSDELDKRLPISQYKDLRKCLVVPVECCHHLRHETTAGALPVEL